MDLIDIWSDSIEPQSLPTSRGTRALSVYLLKPWYSVTPDRHSNYWNGFSKWLRRQVQQEQDARWREHEARLAAETRLRQLEAELARRQPSS